MVQILLGNRINYPLALSLARASEQVSLELTLSGILTKRLNTPHTELVNLLNYVALWSGYV